MAETGVGVDQTVPGVNPRMAWAKKDRYEVTVPGVKAKFQDWMANRGGAKVWVSVDLSNPGGKQYTPVRLADGTESTKPHWGVDWLETITDLGRFRFVRELREVKRFRVALRMGAQGLKIKCTDASTRKIRVACDKVEAEHGNSYYRFDYETQEAVIEYAVWED